MNVCILSWTSALSVGYQKMVTTDVATELYKTSVKVHPYKTSTLMLHFGFICSITVIELQQFSGKLYLCKLFVFFIVFQ